MYLGDNARIKFFRTERHNDPAARLYARFHTFRKRIRVLAGNRQGYYDIHEFFHIAKLQKAPHIAGSLLKLL